MPEDPFDLRAWKPWSRLVLLTVFSACFLTALIVVARLFGFADITFWGWSYILFATALAAWFFIDVLFARRTLYAQFGQLEGTLKHGLRFWRRVAFLTVVVVGFALAMLQQLPVPVADTDADAQTLNSFTLAPFAVLAGAYFASFGWMYTRFEQEKADRASATLEAIRDQLYGPLLSDTHRRLTLFAVHCQKDPACRKTEPFRAVDLKVMFEDVVNDVVKGSSQSISHEATATTFINALNQLALGVRNGQFDLDTIRLLLRPRFIRFAFRYHNMIVEDTEAKPDPRYDNRMRAQKRTYEHFLWLVTKMDVLASDAESGVKFKYITLPPDHIIGTEPGEKVNPPARKSWVVIRREERAAKAAKAARTAAAKEAAAEKKAAEAKKPAPTKEAKPEVRADKMSTASQRTQAAKASARKASPARSPTTARKTSAPKKTAAAKPKATRSPPKAKT